MGRKYINIMGLAIVARGYEQVPVLFICFNYSAKVELVTRG